MGHLHPSSNINGTVPCFQMFLLHLIRCCWFCCSVELLLFSGVLCIGGAPRILTYKVIRTLPHSTTAFTEGLAFRDADGFMIESTGIAGKSFVNVFKVNMTSNSLETMKTVEFPNGQFGEGLVFHRDHLMTLTWLKNKVNVYDAHTLEFRESIPYASEVKEGWGFASDKYGLITSDGSSMLHRVVHTPGRVSMETHVRVHDCYSGMEDVIGLNELETIPPFVSNPESKLHWEYGPPSLEEEFHKSSLNASEYIWANVISTLCIAVVNPVDGQVKAWVLLDGIYPGWDKTNKVANGIAYRALDGTLWVTGKLWNSLFQIELAEHLNPLSVDIKKKCSTSWRLTYNYKESPGYASSPEPCNKTVSV